jgi:uncharacterized protein
MSLSPLFPSPVLVNVLSLFLTNSDKSYYQREISEITGHSLLQVQHALERIKKSDLIAVEKSGNRVYYQAKITHPAFIDLQQAFLKTDALNYVLQQALKPILSKITYAFVFGSLAKGHSTSESDIDFFILGDLSLKETSKVLSSVSEELNREFNPVIMSSLDYKKKYAEKNRFAIELMETAKIWIKGSQNEFRAMVE